MPIFLDIYLSKHCLTKQRTLFYYVRIRPHGALKMIRHKQHYDFLPEGWYFLVKEYNTNKTTSLYTNSGVEVAWEYEYNRCDFQMLDGMEHETEFVRNLFEQKKAHEEIERERQRVLWEAECAARDHEELVKARRAFEDINRPQPKIPSLEQKLKEFDEKLENFKQRSHWK
jgi:hypothetical protein